MTTIPQRSRSQSESFGSDSVKSQPELKLTQEKVSEEIKEKDQDIQFAPPLDPNSEAQPEQQNIPLEPAKEVQPQIDPNNIENAPGFDQMGDEQRAQIYHLKDCIEEKKHLLDEQKKEITDLEYKVQYLKKKKEDMIDPKLPRREEKYPEPRQQFWKDMIKIEASVTQKKLKLQIGEKNKSQKITKTSDTVMHNETGCAFWFLCRSDLEVTTDSLKQEDRIRLRNLKLCCQSTVDVAAYKGYEYENIGTINYGLCSNSIKIRDKDKKLLYHMEDSRCCLRNFRFCCECPWCCLCFSIPMAPIMLPCCIRHIKNKNKSNHDMADCCSNEGFVMKKAESKEIMAKGETMTEFAKKKERVWRSLQYGVRIDPEVPVVEKQLITAAMIASSVPSYYDCN